MMEETGIQPQLEAFDKNGIQQQLEAIHAKLDFLTEQMRIEQQRRRELQELKDDLTRIGKEMFQTAVVELDEVAQHFDIGDLLFLLKKLLRNTRNLTQMLDQVEGAADFFQDAGPLAKQMFHELLQTLDELDRKGYFAFAGELLKIVDTVVTSFTVEDVRQLRDNITSILLTVKNLTQPQMLATVNNAVGFYRKMDIAIDKDISYFDLLKELKNPETKKGLAFLIQFLKNMSATNGEAEAGPSAHETEKEV